MMLLSYAQVAALMMSQKPVRSALSILGIFVGVLALVVILAMHEGMTRMVERLYSTEGTQVFLVEPGFDEATSQTGELNPSDVRRLASLPGVQTALPRLPVEKTVKGPRGSSSLQLLGVDEGFARAYRLGLREGRFFLPAEGRRSVPVMILTEAAAAALLPAGSPLGRLLSVEGQSFEVVGIAQWDDAVRTRASLAIDPGALVPPSWGLRWSQLETLPVIEVRVDPELGEDQALALLRSALSQGDAGRAALFRIVSLRQSLLEERSLSQKSLSTLLAIAAISLLVGGIGVANVMLTSVTERTREIGIRKALGATRREILSQFLVEAGLLSATGGLLAAAVGWAATAAYAYAKPHGTPLAMPLAPVAACILLTTLIGVVAGLYPASRAAASSPADALRYE